MKQVEHRQKHAAANEARHEIEVYWRMVYICTQPNSKIRLRVSWKNQRKNLHSILATYNPLSLEILINEFERRDSTKSRSGGFATRTDQKNQW